VFHATSWRCFHLESYNYIENINVRDFGNSHEKKSWPICGELYFD
jgi:hypothetical protein